MAVTLATINDTLVNQNGILKSTDAGVKNTSQNIDKLVSSLYADRLDRLESDKEAERGVKVKTDKAKGESNSGGMFGGLGNMFKGIGGALAGIPILGGFLISFLKFGKLLLRFGPLAFLIGTVAEGVDTDELSRLFTNIGTAFKSLKTTISGWMTSTDKFMTENGIQLPSLKEVQTFIVNKFNGALKGLNNILVGDFESFGTDIKNIGITLGLLAFAFKPLGVIGLAFKALKGTLGIAAAAASAGASGAAKLGSAAAAALKPGAAAAAAATTPAKVKSPAGKVLSNVPGRDPVTGKFTKSPAGLAKAGQSAGGVAKKFPRFGTFTKYASKVPLLGKVIAGGLLASTLMSDAPMDEKIKGVAGLFAGIGGGVLGGAIGTLIFPGVGTIAGAGIGALMGDSIGVGLAQWLLGQPITAIPGFGPKKSTDVGGNMTGANGDDPMGAMSTDFKYTPKPARPMNAEVLGTLTAEQSQVEAMRRNGRGGGSAPIVIQDNSVRSSSNNSALALPPASSVDTRYNNHSGYIR